MNDEREISLIKYNILLSVLFVISVFVSIVISYNQELELEGKKTFFDSKTANDIVLLNRLFVILIVIGFLIVNYYEYIIGVAKNKNLKPLKQQLFISILNIIAAFIALYIVYENLNTNFPISDIENPDI